jgi:hypothetical protein
MTSKAIASKSWTKPEVKRLGTMKDVAGAAGVVTQGQPNRS